jgi:hypothetical protein
LQQLQHRFHLPIADAHLPRKQFRIHIHETTTTPKQPQTPTAVFMPNLLTISK